MNIRCHLVAVANVPGVEPVINDGLRRGGVILQISRHDLEIIIQLPVSQLTVSGSLLHLALRNRALPPGQQREALRSAG